MELYNNRATPKGAEEYSGFSFYKDIISMGLKNKLQYIYQIIEVGSYILVLVN